MHKWLKKWQLAHVLFLKYAKKMLCKHLEIFVAPWTLKLQEIYVPTLLELFSVKIEQQMVYIVPI